MLYKVEVTSTETYLGRADSETKAIEAACTDSSHACLLTVTYHLAEAFEIAEPLVGVAGAASPDELTAPRV
jgi:hypothetical protein